MRTPLIIDDCYGWSCVEKEPIKLYLNGISEHYKEIGDLLSRNNKVTDRVLFLLKSEYGSFGVIIIHPDFLFASVDRVRSYPIHYSFKNEKVVISNSAEGLRDTCHLKDLNQQSLLEFNMSGYVYGKETLYSDLYPLGSGECLFWERKREKTYFNHYYRYTPLSDNSLTKQDLQPEVTRIMGNVMCRTPCLFIAYLKDYNFLPVFDQLRSVPKPWTLKYTWVPWVARSIGASFGQKTKRNYYGKMYYYATDHDQCSFHGRECYLKNYREARNVVSFDVLKYLNKLLVL